MGASKQKARQFLTGATGFKPQQQSKISGLQNAHEKQTIENNRIENTGEPVLKLKSIVNLFCNNLSSDV
jgi:hypothetical protein